jgi:hypothetical protein
VNGSFRCVVWLLVAALSALIGCKAKAGGMCLPDMASCADPKNALFCVHGTYRAIPCGGDRGCKSTVEKVTCDESVSKPGDPCTGDGGACSADHAALLTCSGSAFASPTPCRGARGCYALEGTMHCDQSVGAPGDPCSSEGSACSIDHSERLHCVDGGYAFNRACRGPKGCSVEGDEVYCDTSAALAGDPCTGGAVCSPDHTTWLSCADGGFTGTLCRGKKGCWTEGNMVHCDLSVASVGDPCTSGSACSEDGTALLDCVGGKRTVARKCRRGCVVGDGTPELVTCK